MEYCNYRKLQIYWALKKNLRVEAYKLFDFLLDERRYLLMQSDCFARKRKPDD